MATISIHNDNGRNHIHIVLCAKKINNLKIDISKNNYNILKEFAQVELAKKYNFKSTPTKNSLAENKKILIDYHKKTSNRELIKNAVSEIKKSCNNLNDFSKELFEKYNIKIETYKTKNNEIKFSYRINNSSGISEDKLGTLFSKKKIENYFENKNINIKIKTNNYSQDDLKYIRAGEAREDEARELEEKQKAIDTEKAITY